MVEAAIALPLMILMLVSVIYIGVFHFGNLKTLCDLQHKVADGIEKDSSIVKKIQLSEGSSTYVPGIVSTVFQKEHTVYGYSLDEGLMVRTGKLVV